MSDFAIGSIREGRVDDIVPVLESFPANIAYVDLSLTYRFVNSRYEEAFSRPRSDIVGREVVDVLGAAGFAIAGPRLRRAIAGETLSYESEFTHPGQEPRWLTVHYIPDRRSDGCVQGIFVFAVDVSRRRRAEQELQATGLRHRLLYDLAPIGICYYDADCRLIEMNRRAAEELGTLADAAPGRRLVDILGGEAATQYERRLREVLATGQVREYQDEVELPTGRKWFLSSYAPVPQADGSAGGVQIVSRDITELKNAEQAGREAEARLRQSQKLQALGSLASGVAHDFNNILQTVLSFTGEMLDDRSLSAQHHEDLGVVRDACRRGAALTSQLLAFSRQQQLSPRTLDAHVSLESVFKMIRRLVGEDIEIVVELGAVRADIRADEGQLAQILLNLAVNARDAMVGGGRLTVTTSNRHLTASAAGELVPGEYLVIGVRDSGGGIAPEIIDRIFEPFFTTKDVGHGTGLGLATVFGIVRQHGGRIDVTSRPGEGALFEVLLPVLADDASDDGDPVATPRVGGSETVLLAEDDSDVRHLLGQHLQRAGYTVVTAGDGDEAVALHARHADTIALAVLDVVMPGRGGCEALAAMRALRPGLPVLFVSGYPLGRGGGIPDLDAALPLLPKPVDVELFCREVRRCLDQADVSMEVVAGAGHRQP